MAIQDKVAALAAVIREFEARADIAHTGVERIGGHERASRSRAVWLHCYLMRNLEQLGVDRIQTATTVVTVRNSAPALTILDEAQIPDEYKRVETTVDRALVRRALLEHREIAGACLLRGRHLVIR